MMAPVILMPLPDSDFEPTEASIPWKHCIAQGWKVVISTEHGTVPRPDKYKLHGPLPGWLSAGKAAQAACLEMMGHALFQHPIPYDQIDPEQYTALLLPGGDGPGVRQYLESVPLRTKVLEFFRQSKLVGAICHGVLVAARTTDPSTEKSVLCGYKVTAPPKSLDRFAYRFDSMVTKHGYIMYPKCVEDEVRGCLDNDQDYQPGPFFTQAFVVCDRNLVSSRTYVDAEVFAERFVAELHDRVQES